MNNIKNTKDFYGKEVGTVHVSIYKNNKTGLSSFGINSDNEDVLQLAYVIEDTLYDF